MITSATWGRRALFSRDVWANLLIDTLYHYRGSAYLLHEFVVMPDHIHVLLTPKTSLEKAVQFIKGGFSFRAKEELGSNLEVWQKGFSDHRIRDAGDYLRHVSYIRENPVRKHLCERAEEYPYSSARAGCELDPVPQGLKPVLEGGSYGAAEAAPFQSSPNQSSGNQTNGNQSGTDQSKANQSNTNQSRRSGRVETAYVEYKSGKIAS
jgi:REP-associated tyrosine transposase